MTTKTEAVHKNLDLLGNTIRNAATQVVGTDPETTYPREVYNSALGKYRKWVGPLDTDWEDSDPGSGTIPDDSVTNAMLEEMPANTAKANITGGAANPTNVTKVNFVAWLSLAKGDVGLGNVDNTSDANKPVSTATQTALDAKLDDSQLDNDAALAANSATKIPTQAAVKAYADALIGAANAVRFINVIDCSANPNYPAADAGHLYRVSVAGKIGGAGGVNVTAGDELLCLVDGTAAGNHATVGANWNITQANLDGVVVGPAVAVDGDFARFDGVSGKLIEPTTLAQTKTDLGITGTETRKFAATIGDGATEDIVVTHNLGNKDIQTTVRDVATDEPISCFPVPTSNTQVTIYFPTGQPPANNSLRCVVIG